MFFFPFQHIAINIILAVIPVVLAFGIAYGMRREQRATGRVRWIVWLPLLIVWLLFLPNTAYLFTEWRHYLEMITGTPVYYQARQSSDAKLNLLEVTGFFVIYSGIGLLTFFLAIWPLDQLVRRRFGRGAWLAQAALFFLCALGVYLGLIPRFNSKDVIHVHMLQTILQTAWQTLQRPLLMGLIVGFGAILWVLYWLFDIWMDGAQMRLRARRSRASGQAGAEQEAIENAYS